MTAEERYARAERLAEQPSDNAARQLVELLADDGSYDLDDGCSLFDRDPTTVWVSEAAESSLGKMLEHAWPVMLEALPTAPNERAASAMVRLIERMPGDRRSALPEAAHRSLAAAVEKFDLVHSRKSVRWERAFATRVRAGEFATPVAFWRARMNEHVDTDKREEALRRLTELDPALPEEVVGWLETEKYPWYPMSWDSAIGALHRMKLAPELVRRLAASELVKKHVTLVWVLAHYGEDAAAIVPVCVDMLAHEQIGNFTPWTPQTANDDRRWKLASEALVRLGPHAASARPALVERLLATNEQMSLQGSLRFRLIDTLGDPRALLAEIEPRLVALEASESVVDRNRAAELRRYIAARIAG